MDDYINTYGLIRQNTKLILLRLFRRIEKNYPKYGKIFIGLPVK